MAAGGGRKQNTSQISAGKGCLLSKTCNQICKQNEEEDNTVEETEDVSHVQSLIEKKEKFMIQHSVRGLITDSVEGNMVEAIQDSLQL